MENSQVFAELCRAISQIKTICEKVLMVVDRQNSQKTDQLQGLVVKKQAIAPQNFPELSPTQKLYVPMTKRQSLAQLRKKPKSPLTPYFLFFNRKREYIRSKYPHLSQSQMANVAGQVWRSLTPQEKQPYQKEYKINKGEYSVKIKQFYEQNPDQMPLKYKKRLNENGYQNDRFQNDDQKQDEEQSQGRDDLNNELRSNQEA